LIQLSSNINRILAEKPHANYTNSVEAARIMLGVPLISGPRLVCDPDTGQFRLD